VLPSRKKTVPIGVPAREVTVTVSASICPKTAVAVDVLSVVVVGVARAAESPSVAFAGVVGDWN
jgi:hypothetical protein